MEPFSGHLGCVWLWDYAGTIPLGEASQCLYHVRRCKSCSLGFPVAGWRVKHLCPPSAFPMCLLVPCPTRIFLSRPVFGMEKHQDRQGLLLVPVAEVPWPGSCVGCNRKRASIASATLGPVHTHPAVLHLKLVLSLGPRYWKPQPLISLPLTWGCVELSEISLSSFLSPQNWGRTTAECELLLYGLL